MTATAYEALAPLVARGMVLDLASMRAALAAVGDPQRAIPCAHVAGTNGKGSVTALVESALRASGLRVGSYTSPHLHRFVERVRVDGAPVSEALAAALAGEIVGAIDAGRLPRLTFFEAATLLAWQAFSRERVAVAVMEVGLGGRLDATNVCAPAVTAITRIAFDHTALLGGTLGAIAREKAGILKAGVPCVLGPDLSPARNAEAREAIEAVARDVGAPLVDAPAVEVLSDDADGLALRVPWRERGASRPLTLRTPLLGAWQAGNVAVAAGVLQALADAGFAVTADAVVAGVAAVRWPARMERLGDVLFDVAHNLDGVEALVRALPASLGGARVGAVMFGASSDKDYAAMLATLAGVAPPERWFFAAAGLSRAAAPEALAAVRGGRACASPAEALARARAACAPGEVALVCGSIFLVAAARAAYLGIEQDPPVGM